MKTIQLNDNKKCTEPQTHVKGIIICLKFLDEMLKFSSKLSLLIYIIVWITLGSRAKVHTLQASF